MTVLWNDKTIETLKRLWLEGIPATQIARIIGDGATRNAVIGKVHRIKLPGRARRSRDEPKKTVHAVPYAGDRERSRVARQKAVSVYRQPARVELVLDADKAEPYVPQPEIDIPKSQRLTLIQLNEQTCKYPIGDPQKPDFYFCGGHADGAGPYCEFHSKRAYNVVTKRAA